MRIRVRLAAGALRRWHLALLQRLAKRPGVEVNAELCEAAPASDAVEALFRLETWLFSLPRQDLADRIETSSIAVFQRGVGASADLVIDLTTTPSPDAWRLAYDGRVGDPALVEAIVAQRLPLVTLIGPQGVIAMARPGTEYPGLARATLSDVFARLITLFDAALDGAASAVLPSLPEAPIERLAPASFSGSRLAAVAARRVKQRAVRDVYRLGFHSPQWRVGWRRLGAEDLIDLRHHPESGWNNLADDGRRFYADPFPLLRQGKVTLFVEEFEHRLGKGIISAVEFNEAGPVGAPNPVLELPHHLSYPNVFERDGEVWMIPESCTAGTVDLYRATAFPGGWTHEARLLDNVVASDATLLERDGAWWMFATVQDGGGSFSDALCLWRAPSYRGPWTAHARNPVLIDIASARPAGRMVERDGALYRPVQDCRIGYGAALGLARVDKLDDDGFSQTVETIVRAGGKWPGRRIHTLNSAGPFEFIDGSAFAPRWSSLLNRRSALQRMRVNPGLASAPSPR